MSEPLAPGGSLESDLRLIREARGFSREEVFSRVHIRPEVLAQVEEHGFGATPTLNSDIHRRSFVKHYADAVEIDAEIALAALQKSLTGFYDGSLAVEYLGLGELKSVPRWAQTPEDAVSDAESEVDEVPVGTDTVADEVVAVPDFDLVPAEPALPEFDIPEVVEPALPEFDVPEVVDPALPEFDVPEAAETPVFPEPETEPETESEAVDEHLPDETSVPESEPESESEPEPQPEVESEPESNVSPYAPPKTVSDQASEGGGPPPPQTTPPESGSGALPPVEAPAEHHDPLPEVLTVNRMAGSLQDYNVPSSATKESVMGPPGDDDFGDEESFVSKLRGRHWLTWIGLTGVVVVLLLIIGQAIFGEKKPDLQDGNGLTAITDLPDHFSGIVRLTLTTERFVNLQIYPDSTSLVDFDYKMWTDNERAIFSESGRGHLNTEDNQLVLEEPYGVAGIFQLEEGSVRIRSVRRVGFPRWEFTGLIE